MKDLSTKNIGEHHNLQQRMAYQKRAFVFILASFVMLCVANRSHAVASPLDHGTGITTGVRRRISLLASSDPKDDDDDDVIVLSLYYESLCPYCADFIANQLVKVFQTDLSSIVKLKLVPWGNTQITPNNAWICQVQPQFHLPS